MLEINFFPWLYASITIPGLVNFMECAKVVSEINSVVIDRYGDTGGCEGEHSMNVKISF